MASISSNQIFRDYYAGLLKHPKKTAQDRLQITKDIQETLQAFAALYPSSQKSSEQPQLTISGKLIDVSKLKSKEVKVFARFLKEFTANNALPEQKAVEILSMLTPSHLGIGEIIRFKERQSIGKDLEETKKQLLLHEQIETHKGEKGNLTVETNNCLSRVLKNEQQKMQNMEKKLKKGKKKERIVKALLVAGGLGGLAMFVAGIVLPGLWTVALILTGAMLFGVGFAPFPQPYKSIDYTTPINEKLSRSMEQLEHLEKCRKSIDEKEFLEFAKNPNNGFENFKNDDKKFIRFLHLYHWQKDYDSRLLEMQNLGKEMKKLKVEGQIKQVEKKLTPFYLEIERFSKYVDRINDIREDLNLTKIEPPNF